MSFSFEFRTVETERDLLKLIDFLAIQDLSYPNYQDWVGKTKAEMDSGYKTGVMAVSDNFVLGNIIWQPHKEIAGVREIKNMRVHPSVRERYFARFLMKQAEIDGNPSLLMCDLREDHPEKQPLIRMLISMGYDKLNTTNLYDPNVRDIVMMKQAA